MALGERWSAHTGRWKALPGAGEPSRALESPLPGAVAPSGSLFTLRVCPETSVRITKFSEHEPD
jgi:hypothetical protein